MTVPPTLLLDLVSSHFARVWGPCLVLRGFHFDCGSHVRCRPCVQPLCLEIRVWSDSGRVTLWFMLQAGLSNHFVGILDDRASGALPGPCF